MCLTLVLERELQLQFHFTQTSVSAAGRDAQTSSLVSYRSRLQHGRLHSSNQEVQENCRLSTYCFCVVRHVWGAGQWSWRWRNKRTPVFQECVYGDKGIYLTMKHGNKCAYIEQCEDVSYRYSTSKGRASPKPKKRVNMNLYFFEECKMWNNGVCLIAHFVWS